MPGSVSECRVDGGGEARFEVAAAMVQRLAEESRAERRNSGIARSQTQATPLTASAMSTQRHRPKPVMPPVLLPHADAAAVAPPARPPLHHSPRPIGQRYLAQTTQHYAGGHTQAAGQQPHAHSFAPTPPAPAAAAPMHTAGATVFSPRPNNVYTPVAKLDTDGAGRSQNMSFAQATANMQQQHQQQPFNWRSQLQHSQQQPQQQPSFPEPHHSQHQQQQSYIGSNYSQHQQQHQQQQQQSYLSQMYPGDGSDSVSAAATSPVASSSYVDPHHRLSRRPAAHEFDPSQAVAFGGPPMPAQSHSYSQGHAAPRAISAPASHSQHHAHSASPPAASGPSSDDFGFEDPLHSPHHALGGSKFRRGAWALLDPTLRPAIFNLCNMILGSGVVALPAAVASAGVIPGLTMLCVLAAVSAYSLRLLIASASALHVSDYDDLLRLTFGSRGRMVSLLSILALDLGAMVTFLIIIGDTMPPVMCSVFGPSFASRNGTLCFIALAVVLPLSCLRSLRSLAWASMASVLSVLAIVVIVCGKVMLGDASAAAAVGDSSSTGAGASFVPVSWGLGPSFLSAFGCLSFVFVCHDLSFPVFQSIGAGTGAAVNGSGGGGGGGSAQKRWARVVDSAVLLSLVPSIALSLAGVVGFGANVASNVLNSFPTGASLALPASDSASSAAASSSLALTLCRASLGLSMVATYPLNCYMCRQVIVKMGLGAAAGKSLQASSALSHGKAGGGATRGAAAGAAGLSLAHHFGLTLSLSPCHSS